MTFLQAFAKSIKTGHKEEGHAKVPQIPQVATILAVRRAFWLTVEPKQIPVAPSVSCGVCDGRDRSRVCLGVVGGVVAWEVASFSKTKLSFSAQLMTLAFCSQGIEVATQRYVLD